MTRTLASSTLTLYVAHWLFKIAITPGNIATVLFFHIPLWLHAQSDVPLSTWRLHVSYNNIHSVAISGEKVFGASENGIAVLDRSENSLTTFTKLNGLYGVAITSIAFDNVTTQLLIGYRDGRIDVVKDRTVVSFDPAQNSTVTGSKKINHISIHNNLAYLAADYGVIIFDLARSEVKETWRDIGIDGTTVRVSKSTFKEDSIFLATDKGVFAGDLRQNLLDFNFWKRFDAGEFSGVIQSVEAFGQKVYATVKSLGLYRYEGGSWSKENFLQNEPLQSLNSSAASLLISSGQTLWQLDGNNVLSAVSSEKITYPNMALEGSGGQLWIADGANGIVSNAGGNFSNFLPNGPASARPSNLGYHNKSVYALGGGYSSTFAPLGNLGTIDRFSEGLWSTQRSTMLDLTSLTFDPNSDQRYIGSFGYGVEERNAENSLQIFNENNSNLVNTNPPERNVTVTAVQKTTAGLWVSNYGASQSLHLLDEGNVWTSYSFAPLASRYPVKMDVDFYGNVWLVLNPQQGGGVISYNKSENNVAYLTDIEGSGGLPSRAVLSIAVDRDGFVWLGTDEGVCYFADPQVVFSGGVNAVRPVFEDRFLLRDDRVTAVAVDGGNRKWIGTERGVWLFNASGDELIYNFTTGNSPLLSNVILDIDINHHTGEVFFATDQGLVSFRSDATESGPEFENVKIFPNPVTPEFSGMVAISGLATDAIVKITDVSGKLVWQGQANGGTVSWNVRDYHGKRPSTGMYLVFSATADGNESVAGKIAIVE
ncbi:MAG TPA: two-component regulator propeller domain-containing protein [Chryseolinea sp.]